MKWAGFVKKHMIAFLVGAEIILLAAAAVVCATKEYDTEVFGVENPIPFTWNAIPLEKGYYAIDIYYSSPVGSSVRFAMDTSYGTMYGDIILLRQAQNYVQAEIELKEDVEKFYLDIENPDDTEYDLQKIQITETRRGGLKKIFLMFCFFALADAVCVLWKRGAWKDWETEQKQVCLALCGICLAASVPLFINYTLVGYDIYFHLMRIEGIANELRAGVFPVKMHTSWMGGYGYPASVMYPDLLLYIPALLRLIGFTLQDTYHIYKLLINLITTLTSYHCVKTVTQSRKIGVMGCMLYVWSAYRIEDLYYRNALGEFTAMAFLPLAFAGLYLVLETAEKKKGCICMIAGYTMVLQAHLLSFEMVVIFSAIYCVANMRKFVKQIGRILLSAAVALVMNLGFLVPMLDYMTTQNMVVRQSIENANTMQESGMFLPQLFQSFFFGGSLSRSVSEGMAKDMPLSMGLPFLLIIGLWLWEVLIYGKKLRETCDDLRLKDQWCIFIILMLSLWMCCYFFPWTFIGEMPVIGSYLAAYQFAWRFLAMGTLFGTILAGYALKNLGRVAGKELRLLGVFGIVVAAVFCVVYTEEYSVSTSSNVTVTDDAGFQDNWVLLGAEYLPAGTNLAGLTYEVLAEESVMIESCIDEGSRYIVTCKNLSEDTAAISVPRLLYKGYAAQDQASGEQFRIAEDDNHNIVVELPAWYEGNVEVEFHQPKRWILAEVLSGLAAAAFMFWIYRTRKMVS